MNIDLVADNYILVYARCGCGGDPECDCFHGTVVLEDVDLNPLLTSLSVAGALCAAYRSGNRACSCDGGWNEDVNDDTGLFVYPGAWFPGCGTPAPEYTP